LLSPKGFPNFWCLFTTASSKSASSPSTSLTFAFRTSFLISSHTPSPLPLFNPPGNQFRGWRLKLKYDALRGAGSRAPLTVSYVCAAFVTPMMIVTYAAGSSPEHSPFRSIIWNLPVRHLFFRLILWSFVASQDGQRCSKTVLSLFECCRWFFVSFAGSSSALMDGPRSSF